MRSTIVATLGAFVALPLALAQEPASSASSEPTLLEPLEVTGSRILREEYYANSPVTTVTREQLQRFGDVTLETFLNTLPQINPGLTSTSNNPGNGSRASLDLRGLGSNRNLVLIDGRRPVPSTSALTVDVNMIPSALIERVELLTGGAGAAYGADGVSGVINIITKKKFEGLDLRSSWRDSTPERDARERQIELAVGRAFCGGRGHFALGGDYSERERMIKSQRSFSTSATATTSGLPEGLFIPGTNPPTQESVDTTFAAYDADYVSGSVVNNLSLIGFNLDGTLFSRGVFNNPTLNVENFRYPVDESVARQFLPDLYSYNFDAPSLLQLPLERSSVMAKVDYDITDGQAVYSQVQWTKSESAQGLAATVAGGVTRNPANAIPLSTASSNLVTASNTCNPGGTSACSTSGLIVPVTNPFIPADLANLLATRAGDQLALVGSGASEPFLLSYRFLPAGLREILSASTFWQAVAGLKGDLPFSTWRYEAYWSEGSNEVQNDILGNINVQVYQDLLAAPDGGASACAGGFNPFGRQPISAECLNLLKVATTSVTEFDQRILLGYVAGALGRLPAGEVATVLGVEYRSFEYDLQRTRGSDVYLIGIPQPVPANGTNTFRDAFVEVLLPVLRDAPASKSLDVGLGYRVSDSHFADVKKGIEGGSRGDESWKLDLSWRPLGALRARVSFQRAVRAPNFGELFDSRSAFPRYYDPCARNSFARTGRADAAQVTQLCIDTGVPAGAIGNFVAAPGGQVLVAISGNTALEPEHADTRTVGLVLDPLWGGMASGLSASLDYYSITIRNPILRPAPNLIIAGCYNYFGTNPGYLATHPNCRSVASARAAGAGDMSLQLLANPDNPPSGAFLGVNGGLLRTAGLDFQVDYAFGWNQVGAPDWLGRVAMNLVVNRMLAFEQQDASFLPVIDYAGTASYGGQGNTAGVGSSFPEWRANLSTSFIVGHSSLEVRARYIAAMANRAAVQFPGETFTSPGAVTYWDLGLGYRMAAGASIRLGVNNVLDKPPPEYTPNVQSGTDPSLYDVVGRSLLVQAEFDF